MQRLLKLPQVAELLNVSKAQVYNLVKQGYLSKPIKIGKRGSAWFQSDIDNWFESKAQEREMEVANG
ncbi:AlpA family phage regulatory protein [Candidatus Thioglobus sp.]|nr:AlpA family phage regulatory protein [Candidatus Thioglobus sp.]MDB9803084.1 AlpA family phage regulatory protein [Candidatus Thioglobus sp.]